MITTSDAYKAYTAETSVISFEIRFKVLNSSDTYSIYPEDCKEGTFRLVDELCPPGELSVGNTISTYFTVELIEGLTTSANLDFTGVKLFFGIPDENGHPTEAYQRGEYNVERKFIYGKQMKLTGYDHFADANYNSANINNFDLSNSSSWYDMLVDLGFDVTTPGWNPPDPHLASVPNVKVNAEYGLENATKRDIAGYIAQGFCCNFKYNNVGKLRQVFFPNAVMTDLDDCLVGTAIVGTATLEDEWYVDQYYVRTKKIIDPPEIYGETIACNAMAVKAVDGTIVEDAFLSVNTPSTVSGYFNYYISDNPLIRDATMAQCILDQGLDALADAFYTPFSINVMGDPSWESGDIIRLVDANDNVIYSIITSFQYTLGNVSTVSCIVEDVPGSGTVGQLIADGSTNTNVIQYGETVTSMSFLGFGYITYQSQQLVFLIPFAKQILASDFTITSIDNCQVRKDGSGWIYYNNGSARTAINQITLPYDSITAEILPNQGLKVTATCTNGWYSASSTQATTNTIIMINGTLTGVFN